MKKLGLKQGGWGREVVVVLVTAALIAILVVMSLLLDTKINSAANAVITVPQQAAATEQFPGQDVFRAQDAAMKYLRETILNPSVFSLRTEVLVGLPSPDGKTTSVLKCGENWGSAPVVSKNGYFLTNEHVVNVSDEIQQECRKKAEEHIAKEKLNIPLNSIKVFSEYLLVKADGSKFFVTPVHTWAPDIDLTLLHVTKKTNVSFAPVVFSDAVSFSDEADAAIGGPHDLRDSIIIGKVASPHLAEDGSQKFIMSNISTQEGNSGGVLVSLSDMKVIGMPTMVIPVEGTKIPTPFNGAIPAWVIKKALKEVNME